MQKIKIVVDSPCDIPDEQLSQYEIEMIGVPICVDGRDYLERTSFSCEEFYPILEAAKALPTTSRISIGSFEEVYNRVWNEGYTDIIVITMNAGGSGINESAQMAANFFFKENSEAVGTLSIHIVDSMTYSLAYGYPIMRAADMAQNGKTAEKILDFLCDILLRMEISLVCYTLEYAKRSGRITAAAALAGDILGLRPTIAMIDGTTKITAKSRGRKKATRNLIDTYRTRRDSSDDYVVIVSGVNDKYGQELKSLLEQELGHEVPHYKVGAAVAINTGPQMVGIGFLGKKRERPDGGRSLVVTIDGVNHSGE